MFIHKKSRILFISIWVNNCRPIILLILKLIVDGVSMYYRLTCLWYINKAYEYEGENFSQLKPGGVM